LRQFKELHGLTKDSACCFPASNREGSVDGKTVSKQIGDRQMQFKNRRPLQRRRNDNTLVLAQGRRGEWTPHDLRRTAATMMQMLGIQPDVIDRCQNHVMPGSKVRRHYMHYDFADEKREAWQRLGEKLDSILGPAGAADDRQELAGSERGSFRSARLPAPARQTASMPI
jgi:hypothetical protein